MTFLFNGHGFFFQKKKRIKKNHLQTHALILFKDVTDAHGRLILSLHIYGLHTIDIILTFNYYNISLIWPIVTTSNIQLQTFLMTYIHDEHISFTSSFVEQNFQLIKSVIDCQYFVTYIHTMYLPC